LAKNKSINLRPWAKYDYIIPWARITTPSETLQWIRHLNEKNWCDRYLIQDLIDASAERNGFDQHGIAK
jgi:hypothetical protein